MLYDENHFKNFYDTHDKISMVMSRYKARTSCTSKEIYHVWLKNRPDTVESFADFVNQVDWRVGQELAAEYQSKFDDVYYYLFSEQSPPPLEHLRSCHAVNLPFIFNVGDHIVPNPNFFRQVQASWAAFAATGNPNNEFISHWEKYSVDNRRTMELNLKDCILHKDLNTDNLNSLRYVYES